MIAVEFSDTITLGSLIVGLLLSIGAAYAIVAGVRWRVAAEVSSAAADELRKAWSDEKAISAAREERLLSQLTQARGQLDKAQQTISRLESLPDLARVVSLLDSHETRAQDRHEAVVDVLRALTDRLTT